MTRFATMAEKKSPRAGLVGRRSKIGIGGRLDKIGAMLSRYGADAVAHAANAKQVVLAFNYHGRSIRFRIALDGLSAREVVQRGAALELSIRARLEAIAVGVESVEGAFLSHLQLDTGQSVLDWVSEELEPDAPHDPPSPVTRPRLLRAPPAPSTPLPALPSSAPASAQPGVSLPVVELADIASPSDHFRCLPLRAKVRASVCVGFQATPDVMRRDCEDCPDGRRVKAALAAHPQARAAR